MEKKIESVARIRLTPEFSGKLAINMDQIIEMDRQHHGLKFIRGNVIEITIDLEKQLEFLISTVLFGYEKNGEAKFFVEFMLYHLTFESKIKIFRSLYKTCSFFEDLRKECEELTTKIKNVNNWRNRFAHGEIAFKTTENSVTKEPYLFYYYENEQKNKILNNQFFDDEINPLFLETQKEITIIRNKIDEKFKENKPTFSF